MNSETNPIEVDVALKRQRLFQFSGLMLVVFALSGLNYGVQGRSDVALILGAGALLMAVSLSLASRHSLLASGAVLWTTVTAVISIIIWRSDGLMDSALLAYPAILIGAGQLLRGRHFLGLFGGIVAFVSVLGIGTVQGWYLRGTPGTEIDRLTDTVTILLVSGFLIWVTAKDMHNGLARLKTQLRRNRDREQELIYLAQHDALTRLPNRSLGGELMEQAMAGAMRRGTPMALLFVDLDNFKHINDSLGHSAGDGFLRQVALRLRAAVRKSDIVCRQGGDEFLVGLTEIADAQAAAQSAQSILAQLQQAFKLGDNEIHASCSVGIAMFPKDGGNFEDLLRHADLAMYSAKDAGRNAYRFFDEDINITIRETLHLLSGMRVAIAQQEFVLHYQPVMCLASGRLKGVEALVRWQNPQTGLVSPGLFIPAAEKSGLIVDIGQWVLQEACRQMRAWRDAGAPDMTIAVNLSPVQFRRGNVEDVVAQALRESGLEPACLELEVTESTLVQDTERFIASLQKLKDLGVRISIDDFGTGYSNLAYLQRFAVHKLKIDQSFVRQLLRGPQDLAIVTAIIQIAKSLELTTTAEGVEEAGIRDQLMALGCDQAQGYYFARPLTADAFEAFWRAQAKG